MTPESKPRVRFAPSPTGYLHVGSARTALFNWLFARHHGGTFILRIEDTDQERNNPAMVQAILEGMTWLGLDWDEGPLHQADGLARHQAAAQKLLSDGTAYRCFCTPEELERKRADLGGAYRYDRLCRSILRAESDRRAAAGEPFTIRFQVPDGATAWDDAVHGRIRVENESIDDFVVLRSDGTPIYNLAVVSDDIDHRVSHVIRGDDHISNTPKQILLYRALGQPLPVFAHVPMILGSDGKRLSKRHGATAISEYQNQGILPEALRNFLALLGWSPGDDREILTADELTALFSLDGINRKSAVFDRAKLEWMNSQYINASSAERLEPLVTAAVVTAGIATAPALHARRESYYAVIDLVKPRARTVPDIAEQARGFLVDQIDYAPDAVQKYWKDAAEVAANLDALRQRFVKLTEWTPAALEAELRKLAESLSLAAGKLIHPLRVALIGTTVSPGIFDVLAVMGRDLSLRRIDAAIDRLRSGNLQSNPA